MSRARSLLRHWSVRWLVAPAIAGALLSALADPDGLLAGRERVAAVFLVDGQVYFGHLEDRPWSDSIVLRDVYYFAGSGDGTALTLARRGSELHQPADGMRIRREKVLLVEIADQGSAVFAAIATERRLAQAGGR